MFSVFFIEFEKRYREVEKSDMKLPSGVKAYFLLQAANLTTENERLARTTAKLEFDDMKVQLQKVFGEAQGNGKDAAVPIKTEENPAYMTMPCSSGIMTTIHYHCDGIQQSHERHNMPVLLCPRTASLAAPLRER